MTDNRNAAFCDDTSSSAARLAMYTNGIKRPTAPNRFVRQGMKNTGSFSSEKSVIWNTKKDVIIVK